MTVSVLRNKAQYTGNGSSTQFEITFAYTETSQIKVYLDGSLQTLTTHYTITDPGQTGTVTFVTAPASGVVISLIRETDYLQTVDYANNDILDAETLESAFDKLTMMCQQLRSLIDGSVGFDETVSDAETTSLKLAAGITDLAGKLLAFDATGNFVTTQEIGTWQGNYSASTAYVVRDIVKDSSTDNVYFTKQNAPAGTSLSNTTYFALLVDVETVRTLKEAAELAETNAETAQAAAEAALASFQGQYKVGATNPYSGTPDAGDLWYDTTNSILKYYVSGTGFEPVTTSLATVTDNYLTISNQVITAGTVPISLGGTGSTTASGARTALGLAIGTDVQAYDADTTKNDVSNTFSANQIISVGDNTNAALRITQTGTGNALVVEDDSGNPDSTPFVVNAIGNVGIGTTSPSTILHIKSSAPAIRLQESDGTSTHDTSFVVRNADNFSIQTRDNSNNFISTDYQIETDSSGANVHRFYISNSEKMRIDSSGNVGIGTTTPNSKLNVSTNSTDAAVTITQTGTGNALVVEDSANPDSTAFVVDNIGLIRTGGESIEINYDGSGTKGNRYAFIDFHGDDVNSDYGLRILRSNTGENASSTITNKGTGSLSLTTEGAGTLVFNTNSTERMRIDSSGRVGIGTSSPSQKLDVSGNINATGALTLGTALAIAEGGTGATSALAARIALLPSLGTAGQVLAVNTGTTDVEWVDAAAGGGSGTVTSVAISGTDGIEVDSGSPITTSGTINLGINAATLSTHLSLGTAATTASTDYATAAQGTLADSAVQPGDDAADLGSGVATDGYVLTADGTGGTAWEATTGGLSDLVSDTTPQLGGNLDVNGQSIVSVSAGNISITPDTTGKIILDGLSWPTSDGSADQVLKTDGAGNLSFVDPASGSGSGTVTSVAISGSDGIEVDLGSPITTSGTIYLGINTTTLSSHLSLGTAAFTASTNYATAAQGTLAASAVQPGDDAADLGSGAATDGYVLTADGSGGAAWEAASGGGGGTTVSGRNLIINGDFRVNQRGAASRTATSNAYNYDRWYYDGTYLYQVIEDLNVVNGDYTISWSGSGLTAGWVISSNTTSSIPASFNTVTSGSSFTVSGKTTGDHLWIRFGGTLANLADVQVEAGTVATTFERRLIGTELELCQRYYYQPIGRFYTGTLNHTDPFRNYVTFPCNMRATPSVTVASVSGGTLGTIYTSPSLYNYEISGADRPSIGATSPFKFDAEL